MKEANSGDLDVIDYVVVSSRVLSHADGWLDGDARSAAAPFQVLEAAGAVGVCGAHIGGVWDAAAFRSGPLRDAAIGRGKEIIDVGDRPLVPAFVNGHTHLAMAPLRGLTSHAARKDNVVTDLFFRIEEHLTAGDVRAFTKFGAFESLLSGVGQVWDHYYYGEEVAAGLREAGLTGVVAPTLQDLSGPGKDTFERQLLATEAIAGNDDLRSRGIFAALGPHASDTVSPQLLRDVGRLARELGVPVHWHLAQSYEEHEAAQRTRFDFSSSALSALGDASVLMAHGLFLTDRDCEKLASAGWVLAYCPLSQLQFGFLSPLARWLEVGGRWTVGTDCVASNDALDVQRELPMVGGNASLLASFDPKRTRFSASGGSAAALDLEQRRRLLLTWSSLASPEMLLHAAWGGDLRGLGGARSFGLAPGALANFLVLDPDHPALFPGDDLARSLAYGATSAAIEWMVVGGRCIGREGGGLERTVRSSEQFREALTEARRRRGELFERARIAQAR